MGSVILNFVGGIPFQGLYEVVKVAVHMSRKFKTHLVNLEFTLRCIHAPILEEIRNNYVRLNLQTDTVVDLKQKVIEGKARVVELSELSMWNIRIWGNCCNCIEPDYAKELDELDRTLCSLLELLELEQMRNITELMCLAKAAKDKQDDLERQQGELLTAVQELRRKMDEILATLKEQHDTHDRVHRIIPSSLQKATSSSRGGAANPAIGIAFQQLVDVVQVKVENMMVKRLLNRFKSTVYCLQPLIEEIAEHGRLVHLPEKEVENLTTQIENGVEYVLKLSKVRKHANYKKCKFTNKFLSLDKSLQRLFIELKGQVERKLEEVMEAANKIEMEIKKIEAEGLCDVLLPELPSSAVGFDILNMQGLKEVTQEALLESASFKEEGIKQIEWNDAAQNQIKPEASSHVSPELSSPADGSEVLNLQMEKLDPTTTTIAAMIARTEGIEEDDDSTRAVQDTTDLQGEGSVECQNEIAAAKGDMTAHGTSGQKVTLDKRIGCETATAELLPQLSRRLPNYSRRQPQNSCPSRVTKPVSHHRDYHYSWGTIGSQGYPYTTTPLSHYSTPSQVPRAEGYSTTTSVPRRLGTFESVGRWSLPRTSSSTTTSLPRTFSSTITSSRTSLPRTSSSTPTSSRTSLPRTSPRSETNITNISEPVGDQRSANEDGGYKVVTSWKQ